MHRSPLVILLVAIAGLGWMFASGRITVNSPNDIRISLGGPPAVTGERQQDASLPPPSHSGPTFRLASFNIQTFGSTKAGKPHVMNVLADIAAKFDLLAIQEIRTQQGDYLLREFVERINAASGRQFDYVIGPRLGRTNSKEQYAFLFDLAKVEIDRQHVYTLRDPDDLLHREPLIGHFRVRGPPPEKAFTFTLVNIHTDPDEAEQEVDVLADVYRVVRQASQGEDDIIILGDFNVPGERFDIRRFGRLGRLPGVRILIHDKATNTRGNRLYDNFVIHGPSTVEFSGRSDVFDVHGVYNLSQEQTLDVSDHLPVWAEFSLYENGHYAGGGRVAEAPGQRPR